MARSKQNARRGKAKKKEQPTHPKKARGVLSEISVGRSGNAPPQDDTTQVKIQQVSVSSKVECTVPTVDPIVNKFALKLIDQRLQELLVASTLSLGSSNDFLLLDQVPTLYETRYEVSLDYKTLGYRSLKALLEDLPGVDIYRPSSTSEVVEYIGRHISVVAMDHNGNAKSINTPFLAHDSKNNASNPSVASKTTESIASNNDILPTAEKSAEDKDPLKNSEAPEKVETSNVVTDGTISGDGGTVPMELDSDNNSNLLEGSFVTHRLVGVYFPEAYIDRVGVATMHDATPPKNTDASIQDSVSGIEDKSVPAPIPEAVPRVETLKKIRKPSSLLVEDVVTNQVAQNIQAAVAATKENSFPVTVSKCIPHVETLKKIREPSSVLEDVATNQGAQNIRKQAVATAKENSFPVTVSECIPHVETLTKIRELSSFLDDITTSQEAPKPEGEKKRAAVAVDNNNYVFDFDHPADAFIGTIGSQERGAKKRRIEDTKTAAELQVPRVRGAGEEKNRWGPRKGRNEDRDDDKKKRRAAGMQLAKMVARDIFPKTWYYSTLLFILSSSPTGLRKREINCLIPELDSYLQTIARGHSEPVDYLSLGDLLFFSPAVQKKKSRDGKNTYHLA